MSDSSLNGNMEDLFIDRPKRKSKKWNNRGRTDSSVDSSKLDNNISTFICEPDMNFLEKISPTNKMITRQSITRLNNANAELYGGINGYIDMSLSKPQVGAIIEWKLGSKFVIIITILYLI